MMRTNGVLLAAVAAIGTFALLSLPETVQADEMEQGITYSCSTTELSVEAVLKDGGGPEDPFHVFENATSATWNIDRHTVKLPIVKTCAIGTHKITFVISQHCAVQEGVGLSAEIFSDTKVVVDAKGKVTADSPPLVQAPIFGAACWNTTEVFFQKIVVRSVVYPGGDSFSVEMR